MTWCTDFKIAVKAKVITHNDRRWYLEGIHIKYCPWCKATLTLDDF